MRAKALLLVFLLVSSMVSFAKETSAANEIVINPYSNFFNQAYATYPSIPRGILEAVAYTQTHFTHITHTSTQPTNCSNRPNVYGVMGLIADGQGYFRNNLQTVSQLSGIDAQKIMDSPEKSIMAYAAAYHQLLGTTHTSTNDFKTHAQVLLALSELPLSTDINNDFVLNTHLYGIVSFLNDVNNQKLYGFPNLNVDAVALFGRDNYAVLSSHTVIATTNEVETPQGQNYRLSGVGSLNSIYSTEYPPAIWTPAASCNYGSRNGTSISAVTIHTTEGSYAGSISWFQSCQSNVSAHYVIRSSDGQVTQMLLEQSMGYHVRSANPYTIGIEHEAFITQASYYTVTMLTSSADLVRDICNSGYGINPLSTYYGPSCSGESTSCEQDDCVRIKGHQMFPNQSHNDPGPNWNWALYYRLINNNPTINTITTATGTAYDAGGASGSYNNDERKLTLIAPTGATKVTLSFSQFDFENNYDWLFIYDGATLTSPLIGKYTGTSSPGTVTATSGKVLIEYRTDCSTNNAGFIATWTSDNTSSGSGDITPPTTEIQSVPAWTSNNFTATFADNDNLGVNNLDKLYYQVTDYNGTEWRANNTRGFFNDNFDGSSINSEWKQKVGSWSVSANNLQQTNQTSSNTNIYAPLNQNIANDYLYTWAGKISGSGSSRRAGFHFMCDAPDSLNRGNSYFIWFRLDDQKIQLYKTSYNSSGNVFGAPVKDTDYVFVDNQWYDFKVSYNRITGLIRLYVNDKLEFSYTDANQLSTGRAISFRSANATYFVNNLRVYRSRTNSEPILVGSGNTNDLRYQNSDPLTPAGKIRSIATDKSANISAMFEQEVNVDWTPPTSPIVIDGLTVDADTTSNFHKLDIAWQGANDPNSSVVSYKYAIGNSPGSDNISPWKDTVNLVVNQLSIPNLNLTKNVMYYATVKAVNGVGMESTIGISNGIKVTWPESIGETNRNISKLTIYPNPVQTSFTISLDLTKNEAFDINLTDVTGRTVTKIAQNQLYRNGDNTITVNDVNLSQGIYFINFYSIENHIMSTYKIAVK